MKFLICLTSRAFFPGDLVGYARKELSDRLTKLGMDFCFPPAEVLPSGAVGNRQDGRRFAEFLRVHENEFDGVLLILPNFGDETASAEALQECRKPIYMLAYPDEIEKMSFAHRRDSFCGKLSMMNVFRQHNIRFTAWEPHVLAPSSEEFARQMNRFAGVCRIVKQLRNSHLAAIGARPNTFQTVRCDETALQNAGISVDTYDNSEIFQMVDAIEPAFCAENTERLRQYSDFSAVSKEQLLALARILTVLEQLIRENHYDAISIRCWDDFQRKWHVSPCVLLSMLGNSGIPAACELDTGNAVMMLALQEASASPATCLDWNNNYGENPEQCILFHCGCVPTSLMVPGSKIADHAMFAKVIEPGVGLGCNTGRIAPGKFTYASLNTEDGKIFYYSGEAEFLDIPLPAGFFGCGGIAQVPHLQKILYGIGRNGFRHHVGITAGNNAEILNEALSNYLGFIRKDFF